MMREGHVRFWESLGEKLARPTYRRSYDSLFCTVAETGEALDVWHGSDKVHDFKGARAFILARIREIRQILPKVIVEIRLDCALFGDEIGCALDALGIQYSFSVACERLKELNAKIERRHVWHRTDCDVHCFECYWVTNCWNETRRSISIRTREPKSRKGPLQLNLCFPDEHGYQVKLILINVTLSVGKFIALHNARGAQEAIFADLKSKPQMSYIPCRHCAVEQTRFRAAVMAHNLNREQQMSARRPGRFSREERRLWWSFVHFGMRRMRLIGRQT